jgi:hypothetical protein
MEVETPLEEQIPNIRESIQGFHVKIIYLEACMIIGTPPKEREKRDNIMTTIV